MYQFWAAGLQYSSRVFGWDSLLDSSDRSTACACTRISLVRTDSFDPSVSLQDDTVPTNRRWEVAARNGYCREREEDLAG